MKDIMDTIMELGVTYGGKIVLAIVVLIVGSIVVRKITKVVEKVLKKDKFDKTLQLVIKNIVKVLLYAILAISVIEILGIPMTSVLALLASCGLAVGLSLQGALTNFAGGLMILIFKPFKVGDFIDASGAVGTVKDITIFYTIVVTPDNVKISVPNGDLMNANVSNYSAEDNRRVDLDFKITNDTDPEVVKNVLLTAAAGTKGVLENPAPFTRLTAVDDDTYIFTVRIWTNSANYWDVRFDALENCSKALAANGIDDPEERIAIRIVKEEE